MKPLQHFILTRFNVRIWHQDKYGNAVRTKDWLEHRFSVFEKYCLPSIANQTCKDFVWIVLFDSETPDDYKARISEYQVVCPQLSPIFVEPVNGRYFSHIFRAAIAERLDAERVLSTYLDNDDALDIRFVEDIQKRVQCLPDGAFIYYSSGLQYFSSFKLLLRIVYKNNHFMSVVEAGNPSTLKSIYGYGSHTVISRIPDAVIEYVDDMPLWCEVIHERNMGNDAYFLLGTKVIRDNDTLRRDFCIDETSRHGLFLYVSRFIPRYIRTFFRRAKWKVFGRKW